MRRAASALLLALVLAGCGGADEDPQDVLAATAGKLGEIRSGTLDFALLVTPREGDEFGFELRGPFSFAEDEGGLPVMDVEYTQIANGERGTVQLVSTGERAYARVGDELEELSSEQADELRSAVGGIESGGGLPELPIGAWVTDAEVSEDGDEQLVEGELDVVEAVNGLVGLARSFGREMPLIEGDSAEQLRDATKSTLFELRTGKEDRLLRLLRVEADFGLEVPEDLRASLGELVGAKVAFRLGVDDPNRTVTVADPEG